MDINFSGAAEYSTTGIFLVEPCEAQGKGPTVGKTVEPRFNELLYNEVLGK